MALFLSKLTEAGFGENEIDSVDTESKHKLCLCIQGIFEQELLNIFKTDPFEGTRAYITGFYVCSDIYIKEDRLDNIENQEEEDI